MVTTTTKVTKEDVMTRFDDIVAELLSSPEPIEVEDGGETIAILLSPDEYRALRRERAWSAIRVSQAKNADNDPDEVMNHLAEVVHRVRREMRESG